MKGFKKTIETVINEFPENTDIYQYLGKDSFTVDAMSLEKRLVSQIQKASKELLALVDFDDFNSPKYVEYRFAETDEKYGEFSVIVDDYNNVNYPGTVSIIVTVNNEQIGNTLVASPFGIESVIPTEKSLHSEIERVQDLLDEFEFTPRIVHDPICFTNGFLLTEDWPLSYRKRSFEGKIMSTSEDIVSAMFEVFISRLAEFDEFVQDPNDTNVVDPWENGHDYDLVGKFEKLGYYITEEVIDNAVNA